MLKQYHLPRVGLATSAALVALTLALLVAVITNGGRVPSADAHGTAPNPGDLLGYAWSSTFGWIDFSCENDPTPSCALGNWGVTVDTASGNVSGYAWSPFIGWIDFNGSACGAAPTFDPSTKELRGYAYALAGVAATAGGWDGCINLQPAAGVGVKLATQAGPPRVDYFDGFAWDASTVAGGPVGIGWIDFCPIGGGISVTDCVHLRTSVSAGMGNPWITATPVSTGVGGTVTIDWGSDAAADTCTVLQGAGSGFQTGGSKAGSDPTSALLAAGSYSFQIECTDSDVVPPLTLPSPVAIVTVGGGGPECNDSLDNDGDGNVDSADAGCIDAGGNYDPTDNSEADVTATFTVLPNRVRAGGTVTAQWNVGGGSPNSCSLTQSNGGFSASGLGINTSRPNIPVADASKSTFTLACQDVNGIIVLTRTVRVIVIATPIEN